MAKIIWTDESLSDLEAIYDHVARDSPAYAGRLIETLCLAAERLERSPFSGHVVEEFQKEHIRQLLRGSFRLVYVLRGDACYIAKVIHASRDLLQHFDPNG